MRVGFVQWPDGLAPHSEVWSALAADVARSAPEVLITNEMPFGPWLAASPNFDADVRRKAYGFTNAVWRHCRRSMFQS